MAKRSNYLYSIRKSDAVQALAIAERVRSHADLIAMTLDHKPGRNIRWEIGRAVDKIASLIGDDYPAGRVLLALSLELQNDFGMDFTATPQSERVRMREDWLARLRGMGISLDAEEEK
jgi:hypothetical protein